MSALAEDESAFTAALRAELEEELRNKRQCTYQSYECTQLCLEGYKFCSKHILQDKNAPFKQCSYVFSSNGKRCHLPALKSDKKDFGYCNEHALRATLARNKQNSKNQPPRTAEVLLHSLSHYVKKPKTHMPSTSYSDDDHLTTDEKAEQKMTIYNDPFVDLDANKILNDRSNEVLDFCSESESDIEPSTLSSVWHDAHADSSDDESIDSEHEDPLKHANVYTAEEITLIIRDKLIKLQSLYVEQYRHLQYLLKEKRRKYLHALKREKETCCNIYNQVRDNPKEQRLYKKLKVLNNYQKNYGVDAILNKRLKDLRNKANDGSVSKPHPSLKCIFTEGGVKCGERTLPLTKYCTKHILEDPNQVLFRACGKMTSDIECTTPIAAIFDDSTCVLHMDIPPLKSYNQVRKDSESDLDDSAEAANATNYSTDNFTENIKHEFVPYDIPPELPKMETLPSLLFEENSQSLSESTISQNEMFGMNDPNLNPNIDLGVKEENDDIGFLQISESCTLVPSTSGLIAITTSTSRPEQSETLTESHLSTLTDLTISSNQLDLKGHSPDEKSVDTPKVSSSLSDHLLYNEPVAGPSQMVSENNETILNESELSQNLNICDEDDIQNESNKIDNNEFSKMQISDEINEIELADVELKTGIISSNDDKSATNILEENNISKVEEHSILEDCEMEVCTDEVLNTVELVLPSAESNTEEMPVEMLDTPLTSNTKE